MNGMIARECMLCVLAALVCSAGAFADETPQTGDCSLRQIASIDLTIGSIVLIPVVVNGTSAFMGLNSGLPVSMIYLQAATEMKLAIAKPPERYPDAPGLVSIDSLSLGSYNLRKARLLVMAGGKVTMPGLPPSIGAIAIQTLPGADVELDFATRS